MKTYPCVCGSTLFFDSTHCVQCERMTAVCPKCRQMTALEVTSGPVQETPDEGAWRCQNAKCGQLLKLCGNRLEFDACNRGVLLEETAETLCTYCRLNQVIPDLSIEGNLEKWRRLEAAKRRVLHGIEAVGLPLNSADGEGPRLRFDFKSDEAEQVFTGHAEGLITINLSEADSVHRERTRVEFGEPQRTLVGHFRHELGHYYWDLLVNPKCLNEFRQQFGDERDPSYAAAQQKYYVEGPPADWKESYISAYAAMHPWEDFAETFAAYLDMAAVVITAGHFQRTNVRGDISQLEPMLKAYSELGIVANELNRDMGLLDLVPEVFTAPVVTKLQFMHELRTR